VREALHRADKIRLEHQREIAEVDGCSSFASAEAGLVQ
jgi:hypothetical protein